MSDGEDDKLTLKALKEAYKELVKNGLVPEKVYLVTDESFDSKFVSKEEVLEEVNHVLEMFADKERWSTSYNCQDQIKELTSTIECILSWVQSLKKNLGLEEKE